jgi:hypothetical protein
MVRNPDRIQEWFGECLACIISGAKARVNGLVAQACLVRLVYLVERSEPDKQNKPINQTDQACPMLIGIGSLFR